MRNVVARYNDGRVVKGTTVDFLLDRDVLHVTEPPAVAAWTRTEVRVPELKALFFVRDLDGDPLHVERMVFDVEPSPTEYAVEITFGDGEVLRGTTPRYRAARNGFFVVPVDAESNNERCYVVRASARSVRFV